MKQTQKFRVVFVTIASIAISVLSACSSSDTGVARRTRIDAANLALSNMNCGEAISNIDPLYNSLDSDNDVRLIRASAYACNAGLNFFSLLDKLIANISKLATNEIWQLFTELFPSDVNDATDRVVEGAQGATDALLASIKNDGVVLDSVLFDADTFNVKSQRYADRTGDSNIYLTFVSMAAIGGFHNRYGNPNATTFKKGNILPWITATATNMSTLGCEYASSVVNYADALGGLAAAATGATAEKLITMRDAFQTLIYNSCNAGCLNIVGKNLDGTDVSGWQLSGCTVSNATCDQCPLTLRNRTSCTGKTSDINSCAAAGIVNFMNTHPYGWQGP